MTYKIQNRSPDNKRIKLIKRSDGRVTFVGNAIPTYQENTIQAGWCMAAISPIPELIDPQTTFELTAAPIGVDGRVSLYRNDTLVSSMRYNDLNSNAAKVKWFNDYFGAVVLMAVIQGITVFTIREEETVVTLVFEDDDIDYNANELSPTTPNRTAFFREQYRLAVGLKLTEIDCTGAIACDGASPIVGSVHLGPAEGDARVGVYVEDKLIGTVDSNVWFDDLFYDLDDPNINISAHYLQEWYPPIISDNGVN